MIVDMGIDALISNCCSQAELLTPSLTKRWTKEDEDFVRAHVGWLTDAEMGAVLGRTADAVHLRRERHMGLPAPSKMPGFLTGRGAARALGVDEHAVIGWLNAGFLPGRFMPGGRNIRLIEMTAFLTWAVTPAHWIYFDIKHVQDSHLKRLIDLRAARWGDEWWTTRQVADYHGVDPKDVLRYIVKLRRLNATRAQYSIGGRHPERVWSNWFVLRSEATRPDLVFYTRENQKPTITPRGAAWILRAHDELGMSFLAIGRTMGQSWKGKRSRSGGLSKATVQKHYLIFKAQSRREPVSAVAQGAR